jgi:hypothetical protein
MKFFLATTLATLVPFGLVLAGHPGGHSSGGHGHPGGGHPGHGHPGHQHPGHHPSHNPGHHHPGHHPGSHPGHHNHNGIRMNNGHYKFRAANFRYSQRKYCNAHHCWCYYCPTAGCVGWYYWCANESCMIPLDDYDAYPATTEDYEAPGESELKSLPGK